MRAGRATPREGLAIARRALCARIPVRTIEMFIGLLLRSLFRALKIHGRDTAEPYRTAGK